MDWTLAGAVGLGLVLLIGVAVAAAELAARLFLEAAEAPRDGRTR
jgi:hypothetical protein